MTDEEPKLLTFTQDKLDSIISERVFRERSQHTEIINLLSIENEALKNKINGIETENLIKEAGLPIEWTQKLTGKTHKKLKLKFRLSRL